MMCIIIIWYMYRLQKDCHWKFSYTHPFTWLCIFPGMRTFKIYSLKQLSNIQCSVVSCSHQDAHDLSRTHLTTGDVHLLTAFIHHRSYPPLLCFYDSYCLDSMCKWDYTASVSLCLCLSVCLLHLAEWPQGPSRFLQMVRLASLL